MKVVYNGINHDVKVFDDTGNTLLVVPARNDSVSANAWRPNAGTPPGNYTLLAPESNDSSQPSTPDNDWIGEGLWFCPITGIPEHEGIGIHGGGSCVYPNSLAPEQGWCPTLNCIRLQNADLETFVNLYRDHAPLSIEVVQSLS